VQEADQVRIPPLYIAPHADDEPLISSAMKATIAASVLYEDDRLLVLNKSPGIAVHGGSGLSWGLIDVLQQLGIKARKLYLAHRLDRDTSGCLLIAKDPLTLQELHGKFRDRAIRKSYQALVVGNWPEQIDRVDTDLIKVKHKSAETYMAIGPTGKHAETSVLQVDRFRAISLMRFEIATGRTHQIRVHAASVGCPIAGDRKYGNATFNQVLRQKGFRRMYLHAHTVHVDLSGSSGPLQICAPLSDDMKLLIEKLRGDEIQFDSV
jgi:23S rRNA pseudouridine955/2504/2580 synthase